MRGERGAVRDDMLRDGVPLDLLVQLPFEDEGELLPGGRALRGLPGALVLRYVCVVPGAQGTQEPGV